MILLISYIDESPEDCRKGEVGPLRHSEHVIEGRAVRHELILHDLAGYRVRVEEPRAIHADAQGDLSSTIDETMLYVHVAEAHRGDLPELVLEAARKIEDLDRRIIAMLGTRCHVTSSRGSHVAANQGSSIERAA
ncbi:MAG: hypothetical protein JNL83_26500 [Myxococcales bacterium]|nr:hypothetical protein [Myxococcales bacterium]